MISKEPIAGPTVGKASMKWNKRAIKKLGKLNEGEVELKKNIVIGGYKY